MLSSLLRSGNFAFEFLFDSSRSANVCEADALRGFNLLYVILGYWSIAVAVAALFEILDENLFRCLVLLKEVKVPER